VHTYTYTHTHTLSLTAGATVCLLQIVARHSSSPSQAHSILGSPLPYPLIYQAICNNFL